MKKLSITVLLILVCSGAFAQHGKKNEVEAGVGFYKSDHNSFVNVGANLTFRHYLSSRFGVGAGLGYEYDISTIEDGGHEGSFIPVFANMQCNLPMGSKTDFIAGVNGGSVLSFGKGIRDDDGFYGMISPHIGFGFDIGKHGRTLLVKAGYKYVGSDDIGSSWGINIGLCW